MSEIVEKRELTRPFGDTELGQMIGCGFLILALCLGIGGCVYVMRLGDAKYEAAKHAQVEKP